MTETIDTPRTEWQTPLSLLSTEVRSSVIREVLSVVSAESVLSLAGGIPAPSCIPSQRLAEAAASVLARSGDNPGSPLGNAALQYGETAGLPSLIGALKFSDWTDRDRPMIITAGSQQALDLLAAALLNPGDGVALGQPSYLGAIQAFSAYRPRFLPIRSDDQGLNTDDLSHLLARGERPRLVYVVSQFSNPDGSTLSEARRSHLADLAERYGFLIVDDDPYGELRFDGLALTPFRQLTDRLVTLGSLSKVLAPGLRVGWAQGPDAVIEAMERIKQARDLHTSTLSQSIAAEVLTDELFVRQHLKRLRTRYRDGARFLAEAIETQAKEFSLDAQWVQPQGGMLIWLRLPGVDTTALLPGAIDAGVAFVPGTAFSVPGADHWLGDAMRLSYSTLEAADLTTAVSRLFATASKLADRH